MVTVKEIAEAVGLNVEDESKLTKEAFTEHVSKNYTLTENILKDDGIKSKIVGKVLGSLSTKAAQMFGLKTSDIEGKKMEEIFETAASNYNAQIEALKADTGKGADVKVEELTKKVGALESELELKKKGLKTLQEQYDTEKKNFDTKLVDYKLNDKKSKVFQAVAEKLSEEYAKNDLVKTGFNSYFDSQFDVALNDKDELIVKKKGTEEIVPSKAKAGHHATLEEVLLLTADEKGILKKNNGNATPQGKIKVAAPVDGEKVRKVHPNAAKNAQRTE